MTEKPFYGQAVEDLEARTTGKDDITIESVSNALQELGNPDQDTKVVLVGGTNGKGSTVEMMSEMLRHQGKKVGSFKSPHLTSVRERIQVNGEKISKEDFLELYSEIDPLDQELSFFEFMTVMAYLHFSRQNVDYAVMEVGMGGKLDATNAAEPELSIITNIDLEHTEYLGDTRQEIAEEKAGITPENGKLVTDEALEPVKAAADLMNTDIIRPVKVEDDKYGEYRFKDQSFFMPVRGGFQRQNLENSLTAVRELEEIPEDIEEALSGLECPGRMERISESPEIVLDGAHNPAAIKAIIDDLPKNFICVFSALETKKIGQMLEILDTKASEFIFTDPGIKWSAEPEEIAEKTSEEAEIIEDPVRAVERAGMDGKPVVVTGSLYLVGKIKDSGLDTKPKIRAEKK